MLSNHKAMDEYVLRNGLRKINLIKLIKMSLLSGYFIYIFLLVENVILASFFGYSIHTNFISELGSALVIPFPQFYDFIVIFGGIFTVFSNFYILKFKFQSNPSLLSKIFLKIGFLSGLIGAIGYIFLGIFSLDRAGPGELFHGLAMGFSFSGYLVSIFFYSLCLFLTRHPGLIKVGIYGVSFPIISVIIFGFFIIPITEWILLYSILSFLLPFYYYIYR